ncbi:MAG: NAD(P)/FAD-dependent oxidoreductase, partial [Candidatus Nanopelagicales bacterium]
MTDVIQVETVIVGAGQCGLAVGYYLKEQGADFVILDEHVRVGDMWRRRYDSLRLYTPARYDGLPGMAFPSNSGEFPTGVQMGDYLEQYAANFDLPVRLGAKVENARSIEGTGGRFQVTAGDQTYRAQNIVVAVGSQRVPKVPTYAGQLDPEIRQFHSDDYRNPGQLQDGSVLIVGASHS